MVSVEEIYERMLGFSSEKLRKYIEYACSWCDPRYKDFYGSFIVEGIHNGENTFVQSELFNNREFGTNDWYFSYYIVIEYDIYLNEEFAIRQNINSEQEEESAPKFRDDADYTIDELYNDILDLHNKMMIFTS